MVKLTEDMKAVLNKIRIFPLATSSKDGTPNVVPIGMLILQPDNETIWVVDNYMSKTVANAKENPKVSIYVWDPESPDSYQIKGSVTVENSGSDYEKAVEFAHSKKETYPAKNLLKIKITDVYYTTPGPKAGQKI